MFDLIVTVYEMFGACALMMLGNSIFAFYQTYTAI